MSREDYKLKLTNLRKQLGLKYKGKGLILNYIQQTLGKYMVLFTYYDNTNISKKDIDTYVAKTLKTEISLTLERLRGIEEGRYLNEVGNYLYLKIEGEILKEMYNLVTS